MIIIVQLKELCYFFRQKSYISNQSKNALTIKIMEETYRILYVDDEKDNLTAFRAVLRRYYDIYTAQSGEEALQVLATPVSYTHLTLPTTPYV